MPLYILFLLYIRFVIINDVGYLIRGYLFTLCMIL